MRLLPVLVLALSLGCSTGGDSTTPDAGTGAEDAGPPPIDGGPLCGCTSGVHTTTIVLAGDEGELYIYDPLTRAFTFVVGPACPEVLDPYSLAVDPRGNAWMLSASTRRMALFDVNEPGACVDSGYLPTVPELPLFGMSFVSDGEATECSTLFGMGYSGEGPFTEGEGIGNLAVIDGEPPRARLLAPTNFDGGELAGTGDGRLFAFAGDRPPRLIEYDPGTGAVLDTLALAGLFRGNASAFAFFGGDLYLFTEAPPPDCFGCLETACADTWALCQGDATCREAVSCALEAGGISDECGGFAGEAMLDCLSSCETECLTSSRGRVSQVVVADWDRSDGGGWEVVVAEAPLRVVGAASSPCVPTVPF